MVKATNQYAIVMFPRGLFDMVSRTHFSPSQVCCVVSQQRWGKRPRAAGMGCIVLHWPFQHPATFCGDPSGEWSKGLPDHGELPCFLWTAGGKLRGIYIYIYIYAHTNIVWCFVTVKICEHVRRWWKQTHQIWQYPIFRRSQLGNLWSFIGISGITFGSLTFC